MATSAIGQLSSSDPWPKYGHGGGNTCFTNNRGAHAPELRWWARLGTPGATHECGVAIAAVDGVNYAIVGTPTAVHLEGEEPGFLRPRLYIFRVADPDNGPDSPATPAATITLPSTNDLVQSTPLVLSNRWVVIQTQQRLLAYSIENLPDSPEFKWSSETLTSTESSPGVGKTKRPGFQGSADRVYALGDGKVVSIDPYQTGTGLSFDMERTLRPGAQITSCPAVGPIASGDPLFNNGVNLVYCSTFGSANDEHDHIFAVFADDTERGSPSSVIAWTTRTDVGNGIRGGTFASPNVYGPDSLLPGKVVVGADDGAIYGLKNNTNVSGSSVRRWAYQDGEYISCTAAISPSGDVLYDQEGSAIDWWLDQDTSAVQVDNVNIAADRPIRGTPALDQYRFYFSTRGSGGNEASRVIAVCYAAGDENGTLNRTWRYLPPNDVGPDHDNLRRNFKSSVVINADGTILAVNDGYLIAIRPMRGDLNGDGCRDNFDIDAFVLGLLDPESWDEYYGAPGGVNLVGVGDCNGDGLFNNFDIDPFVDLISQSENQVCPEDFFGVCGSLGGGGEGPSRSSGEDDGWAHFWGMISYLRDYYGMN